MKRNGWKEKRHMKIKMRQVGTKENQKRHKEGKGRQADVGKEVMDIEEGWRDEERKNQERKGQEKGRRKEGVWTNERSRKKEERMGRAEEKLMER